MQLGLYIDLAHDAVLPHAQFDFLEENVQTLLVPEQDEAAFARRVDLVRALRRPLPSANRFLPPDLKVVGPQVDEARLLGWAETAFRRAEQIGVNLIVWGSGVARRVPDGFSFDTAKDQFTHAVARLAPIAARHGVLIVIEPVSRGDSNFIMSLADGAEIVQRVNHPSVRLLADVFHMMVEGEPASEIERFGDILEHVHIAELKARAVPGTHGDDFRPYLRALKSIGYHKAIVLEPEWTDVTREPAIGLAALRAQMADVGLS